MWTKSDQIVTQESNADRAQTRYLDLISDEGNDIALAAM